MAVEEKKWTYDDYYKLEDERRYEVREGELLMAPAPNIIHQRISGQLQYQISKHLKKKKIGELLTAPCDVVLDKNNVVQPDLVYVSTKNSSMIRFEGVFGAPDMVAEIISPTSHYRDSFEKKALYEKFGVQEYWLVDPANQVIEIFVLKNCKYELFSMASVKGIVSSSVIAGLEINLLELMYRY